MHCGLNRSWMVFATDICAMPKNNFQKTSHMPVVIFFAGLDF
jgi:predicted TIM-barrel fold metal-dependent hydrolase